MSKMIIRNDSSVGDIEALDLVGLMIKDEHRSFYPSCTLFRLSDTTVISIYVTKNKKSTTFWVRDSQIPWSDDE